MSTENNDSKGLTFLESMDRKMGELLDLAKGNRGDPADDPARDPKVKKLRDDAPPDPKPAPQPDPKPPEDPPAPKPGKGFWATILGG